MGVQLEFNWLLALRKDTPKNRTGRDISELIPSELQRGSEYRFRKEGLRVYPLHQPMLLAETEGNNNLGVPRGIVIVREYTHKTEGGRDITEGKYMVERIVDREDMGNTIDYGLWTPRPVTSSPQA